MLVAAARSTLPPHLVCVHLGKFMLSNFSASACSACSSFGFAVSAHTISIGSIIVFLSRTCLFSGLHVLGFCLSSG